MDILTAGQPNLISLVDLTDETSGDLVTTATVTHTLRDNDGAIVTGETTRVCTLVADGLYRATIPETAPLLAGRAYVGTYSVDVGGVVTSFTVNYRAIASTEVSAENPEPSYAESTAPLVFVSSASDFPAAVAGVRTLADNVTYFVTATVDLSGDRLVGGQNTTIIGGSSENCRLLSTGLTGTALLTSAWSLTMRGITIEADVALALDASGNALQALDWFGVNFTDCVTIGTIANYANFTALSCALLNSQGLTFDGSLGTVAFSQCLFDARASGTLLTLPATLTITRRFRIIYSSFVVLSGETGINVSASATVPVEGYILDTVNFSGGGTYTTGVATTDNKALWIACRGVKNSAADGFMTMTGNAVATVIGSSGVAVKALGTTTLEAISQKFSHDNNRLTYTGAITRDFRVVAKATCTSGANNQLGLYLAKNNAVITNSEQYITAGTGGRAENGSVQTIVELATNDFLEFWVENASAATNITVSELSVIAEAIN